MSPVALSAEDRLDILDLFATYAWALDTGDKAGTLACFSPDGVFHGARLFDTAEDFVDFFFSERAGFRGRQHIVTNIEIRGTESGAKARSFCTILKWDTITTNTKYLHGMGWYDDDLVKIDGKWLFRKRVYRAWNDQELPWVGPLPEGVRIDPDRSLAKA